MLAIKNKRENPPLSNQIYDILAELHNQGKQITLLYIKSLHTGIKGNKMSDKAAKTMNKQSHTDYYLAIERTRNTEWQGEWEKSTSKVT